MSNFQKELTTLINKHRLENESDSPDFILAEYILDSLDAYNDAVKKREQWYGRKSGPAGIGPRLIVKEKA